MVAQGPLEGVRVLDFSRLLPGPYCSRVLADFGAEVIKIERPGAGDWARLVPPLDPETGESLLFKALNRGKMSLALNLQSDEGRAILLRLVENADVVVESFRPGVMERLGLGYERLSAITPRLIYCALTGYGGSGPYRQRAGHDLNYIGLAGLLDLSGPRDGPPAIPGAPVADVSGALWAAIGVLLALLAREHTGLGQRVEASLLGGALACLPVALAEGQGNAPIARGSGYLTGGVVCYNVYRTQDDALVTLAALEPRFWGSFCHAVGREHLQGQQLAPAVRGQPAYDELCDLFRSRTRQAWTAALAGIETCCEPVYSLDEALAAAPVQALGMLRDGQVLPAVRLSETPISPIRPAPALGEHTGQLLGPLGYDEIAVEELRGRGVL
jgi:alpha-methylacyl-CoA racemase